MKKSTLRLIAELNELYDKTWKEWTKTVPDTDEFEDRQKKLKLIRTVSKNIEEQARGFLKSRIDYEAGGRFILSHSARPYLILHAGLTTVLIGEIS
ncbi:MAG TPA: hypothetical protein PK765_06565 [bacterium]|nr:hypothetical protein [bacterium]